MRKEFIGPIFLMNNRTEILCMSCRICSRNEVLLDYGLMYLLVVAKKSLQPHIEQHGNDTVHSLMHILLIVEICGCIKQSINTLYTRLILCYPGTAKKLSHCTSA